ncbi:MAG: cytochrome c3 family protein [Jhaorihella sp.]
MSPVHLSLSFLAWLVAATAGLAQQSGQPAYVGSDTCTGCHEDAAEAWAESHHALAWTLPGPDTVKADFDNTTFAHDGFSAAFRVEDGNYFVTVTETDGSVTDYPVHSVAGVAPLQQFLIETEPGRLQSFDVVWDVAGEAWYHLYPDQDLPPGDGLHWRGPYKTWNARCAECHATGYERNYDPRSRAYASTQAEIGVGCEACHGPGSLHLDWARGEPGAVAPPAHGFSAALGQGDTARDIEQCATCHSRREAITDGNPLPGTPFAEAHTLELLRSGRYHADGQILDEVYVYGSFLQSRMYARGVSCMNCHEPHGATLKAEGNAVCTQCHSPAGNPDFPTLRLAAYDDPSHHHHAPGSTGAQCKSCHMIERVYMGIDGRRDHSFRIPRPDLGAEMEAPDACTDCHDDLDRDRAAAAIAEWYPDPARRDAHFGQAFALASRDPRAAAPALRKIALDADRPGIVRATALYFLQPLADPALATAMAPLLSDPDPLVRGGAAGLQAGAPAQDRAGRLMTVLADPVRSVRILAGKQMLTVSPETLTPSQRALVGEAMSDWRISLANKLDFPETHLVLGGIALTGRNLRGAQAAFREVVRLDPQRAEAWNMLVRLAQVEGGADRARGVLNEALAYLPEDPQLLQWLAELGP